MGIWETVSTSESLHVIDISTQQTSSGLSPVYINGESNSEETFSLIFASAIDLCEIPWRLCCATLFLPQTVNHPVGHLISNSSIMGEDVPPRFL